METRTNPATTPSPSHRSIIFVILGVAAVFVVVATIILFLKRDATPQPSAATAGQSDEQAPPVAAPRDTDRDTLSDDEEKRLGTNPQKSDTDGDGLSDAAEVKKIKTDPLRPRSKDPALTDLEWTLKQ